MTPARSVTETCGAKTRSGSKCRRPAGWGTSHVGVARCKLHGGRTPNQEVAGVVELARREMVTMGQPLDILPGDALLECIRITAGEVQYASDQVAQLKDPMVNTMFGPMLHTWIKVRQSAMDRLVTYSKVALSAGIEERNVKIAERQGFMLAQVIQAVLDELGVGNHRDAPRIARKHLELVSGSS